MDDKALRASTAMQPEDLEQDRRLIMKKLQQRRRSEALRKTQETSKRRLSDASGSGGSGGRSGRFVTHPEGGRYNQHNDSFEQEEDVVLMEQQYLHDALVEDRNEYNAAHAQDEQLIGGRIEDEEQEGLEAMNQALTSPPVAWWAMRKQWQKRRGNMLGVFGTSSAGAPSMLGDDEEGGMDGSYRSAQTGMTGLSRMLASSSDAGVVGHPVMLEDPSTMGYDNSAFRQNPFSTGDKRKRTPTVLYVSRDVVQKRKMQQSMYIIVSICVVFLFMFVLEQRKLSHYAMVESPISLDAYIAGEALMAQSDQEKKKVTLGDLGLKELKGDIHVANVEFGNLELNPNDPLANEELANDPMVGNHPNTDTDLSLIHGMDRFELLKGVVVGWGVTPANTFLNEESPQYKALSWMAHEDVLRYNPDNDHWIKKIIQRYVLATVYWSTNGDAWIHPLYFLSNRDECNWNRDFRGYFTGVGHCEGGYITVLALWGNNLHGGEFVMNYIMVNVLLVLLFVALSHDLSHVILSVFLLSALPTEIGSLTSLRTLSIFDNRLAHPPPESIAKLKSLHRLYMQRNSFKANVDYLCDSTHKWLELKSDCGKRGGVDCPCCTACGWNAKNARESMVS